MASERPDKVVQLTLDSSGMPVPESDPITVWRDAQKIRWRAPFEFRITIDGYDQVEYSKGGEGNSEHQCKTGYFSGTTYKYTISANGLDNDPTIQVQP
jgi:hypothetical protein